MPIHPLWIAVLVVLVLIIFGPGRLPELGGAVGRAMREFRKATRDVTGEVTSAVQAKPGPAVASSVEPAAASSVEPAAASSVEPAVIPESATKDSM